MALHCPLQCLLHTWQRNISVTQLSTTELVSLLGLKNRHGHWLGWMSTGRKNGLMWRTHTDVATYAASTAVGNTMPCHHTGYDIHMNLAWIEKRKELKEKLKQRNKSKIRKNKEKSKNTVEETNYRARPPAVDVATTRNERAGKKRKKEKKNTTSCKQIRAESQGKIRSDLVSIQIPRHSGTIDGSMICANFRAHRLDRHFSGEMNHAMHDEHTTYRRNTRICLNNHVKSAT